MERPYGFRMFSNWFLQFRTLSEEHLREIENARAILSRQKQPDSRDRIIASLSFGFWAQLLGPAYDETLWRESLYQAFPEGTKRSSIAGLVESIRQTRNRVAHHNYMKSFDVPSAMAQVFKLAELLSTDYTVAWLKNLSRWQEIYNECPKVTIDTVVVPGRIAWEIYQEIDCYVCQPGRFFQDVNYLAFYENSSIRKSIPKILEVRDDVSWTREKAARLKATGNRVDKKIAHAIEWAHTKDGQEIANGWKHSKYKVFVLTSARGDIHRRTDKHVELQQDIPHPTSGRGTGFVRKQRYISLHKIRTATTTADLLEALEEPDE